MSGGDSGDVGRSLSPLSDSYLSYVDETWRNRTSIRHSEGEGKVTTLVQCTEDLHSPDPTKYLGTRVVLLLLPMVSPDVQNTSVVRFKLRGRP